MQRSFSIITACKGRLEHLKQSLPRMLAQGASEVIVVDYSCPEGTGDYVREHFPTVRVVKVEGQEGFSNWRARNAGAALAQGQVLVFCDADTLLADNAIAWIDEHLPPRQFGYFMRQHTGQFNKVGLRLGSNQLRGFHAIPAAAFRRLDGYDEVLQGYAAGGDTDLEERLVLMGVANFVMNPAIIDDVIQHDNQARVMHHADPIAVSYSAGLLYRNAKMTVLRLRRRPNLPLESRQTLYGRALDAARNLQSRDKVFLSLDLLRQPAGMPLQLGFKKAALRIAVTVEISGEGRVEEVPEF
jgi:glycosyltransferase involved in cell wall biosynthesis